MADFAIHLCVHCGTVCKGKYCSMCSTAAGRKAVDEENLEILKDWIKSGVKVGGDYWLRLKRQYQL